MKIRSNTFIGPVTKVLEEKKSKNNNTYSQFTIKDSNNNASWVRVTVFGKISDVMAKHLANEGALISVIADEMQFWNPEDDQNNIRRYENGDNKGKPIINVSVSANAFGLRFLPKTTGESSDTPNETPSTGDTVRGSDDNQPSDKGGDDVWARYQS